MVDAEILVDQDVPETGPAAETLGEIVQRRLGDELRLGDVTKRAQLA